jgi:hypothetical protein
MTKQGDRFYQKNAKNILIRGLKKREKKKEKKKTKEK